MNVSLGCTSIVIQISAPFTQRVYERGRTGEHEMYIYSGHHMDQHWELQGKLDTVQDLNN